MKEILQDEYGAFLSCYERPEYHALRLNPLKTDRERFLGRTEFTLQPVCWNENGFYYDFAFRFPFTEEHLREVRGLDGLEVLNGSTSKAACRKAAEYAEKLGLFTLGASDCHVPEKVGVCVTYFPEEIRTFEDFLAAFRKGEMKPAYYEDGEYKILR